jgi:hypothetical protein
MGGDFFYLTLRCNVDDQNQFDLYTFIILFSYFHLAIPFKPIPSYYFKYKNYSHLFLFGVVVVTHD